MAYSLSKENTDRVSQSRRHFSGEEAAKHMGEFADDTSNRSLYLLVGNTHPGLAAVVGKVTHVEMIETGPKDAHMSFHNDIKEISKLIM